jgi:hypothetical protein
MSAIIAAAFTTNASSGQIFQFKQGGPSGTIQCQLNFAPNGTLFITPATGGNQFAADTDLIPPASLGIYNYVEWLTGFTHSALNKIWVNGHLIYSGVLDCQNTVGAGADTYYLQGAGGGNLNLFDDFYIINNDGTGQTTEIGDVQVICGIPSSDDAEGWTPTPAGSHYANVDDIPLNPARYNSSIGSLSDDSYFVSPQIPLVSDKIYVVQLTELLADFDGDGEQARPFLITPEGIYSDPALDFTVENDYEPPQIVMGFTVNPKTSAPWAQTDLNNTSWGVAQG